MPIHTMQVSEAAWLVLNEIIKPRWPIVQAPLIHRGTRETHIMHRVEAGAICPKDRRILSVHDEFEAAKAWCQVEAARPDFRAPRLDSAGNVVTVEEQRRSGGKLALTRPLGHR